MALIEMNNLTKKYGTTTALDSVSLSLESGKVIGLIGRNGAGKTTMMNAIAGLVNYNEGGIIIAGAVAKDNLEVAYKISFARETIPFDEDERLKNILGIAKASYDHWDDDKAKDLMNLFKLDPKKKVKKLSKGMKTMFSLLVTLSSGAEILMFDEPTEGLDAAHRKEFYRIIIEEISKGDKTIIISSHLLSELDMLLEEIVLIDDGKVLLHEDIDIIRNYLVEIEGLKTSVEALQEGKIVYNRHELGDKLRIVIKRAVLSKEDFEMIDEMHIRMNPVGAQDACIYLTADTEQKGVL